MSSAPVANSVMPEIKSVDGGTKAPKAKRPAASRKPASHPPFLEMITDAIATLKERTGSSQYAITKFIEERHKQLPSNFRKLLLFHLKKLVAAGKLVKVKNSFKLPYARSASAKASSATAKKPADSKPKSAAKPKPKTAVKPKKPEATGKPRAKAAAKRKAVAKPKAADKARAIANSNVAAKAKAKAKSVAAKPAKVARTAARSSPGKKVASAARSVKKAPLKKAQTKKSRK